MLTQGNCIGLKTLYVCGDLEEKLDYDFSPFDPLMPTNMVNIMVGDAQVWNCYGKEIMN